MAWKWCTYAQVISTRPCLLKNIIMTPSHADGSIWIYDGETDKDPPIGHVFTSIQVTREYYIKGGLETHRGLYIGGFDHIEGALVIWEPIGEGRA